MRFRRFWHRMWVSYHLETERRGRRKYDHGTESVRRHREALDRIDPQREVPFKQDFSEFVRISGPELTIQPAGELINQEQIDAEDYRRRRAQLEDGDLVLVNVDPDGPDSPEADHLFWEETAPDLLKRLERNDADEG